MIDGVRYAATEADLARVAELGRREHALSRWAADAYDEAFTVRTALHFMRTPGMTLLVTDGGYLAGAAQSMGFSPVLCAVEYAWFAEDGSGMKLLRAFEQWAKNVGAKRVFVHAYTLDDRVNYVLRERHQYMALGRALAKELQ